MVVVSFILPIIEPLQIVQLWIVAMMVKEKHIITSEKMFDQYESKWEHYVILQSMIFVDSTVSLYNQP